MRIFTTSLFFALLTGTTQAQTAAPPAATVQLPMHVGGRAVPDIDGKGVFSQWPGMYYEAHFNGTAVTVRLNDAVNHIKIYVDGKLADEEKKPGSGDIELGPLSAGEHTVRLEKLSESQGDKTDFPGFFVTQAASALPAPPARPRQIEFIGDSYTVGYGNTAGKHTCTADELWVTTDTQQGFGALTAKHYDADYQINASSGRGIVRNYDGSDGDHLPVVYPFVLFDKLIVYQDKAWQPQIVVIGLGTNDFSTPLNAGEKWPTRDALHSDYEATYTAFVKSLRARNPNAFFILMATDQVDGEIQTEVKKVMAAVKAGGDNRIDFVPMNGLSFGGCDWHPTTDDDLAVSKTLSAYIDAHPELWQNK